MARSFAARKSSCNGIAAAEAHVRAACMLLERADPGSVKQAGNRLSRAAEIMSRWQASGKPSLSRMELHRVVCRAGRLIEALGTWCNQRQRALVPDEKTASSYGVNGRIIPAYSSGSMTLQG
jgi:hypothetical protein